MTAQDRARDTARDRARHRPPGGRPARGEPVVDRAMALLAAFHEDRRAMTLSELSRHTGIPPSTALRLAGRLVAWGALDRTGDGVYTVGARLWEIGALTPGPAGLAETALPHMRDLSTVTRHHVVLAAPAGDEALMVLRLSNAEAVDALWRTGSRVPLHSSALGRVLLAFSGRDVREAVLERVSWTPDEPRVSDAELRRELQRVRRTGVALVRRITPPDVPTVAAAAPVRDGRGHVVAAVGVILLDAPGAPSGRVLQVLRGTAARISRDLDPTRRC